MTAAASLSAILDSLHGYGSSLLTIIGAVLVLSLGYLIYRFGWASLMNLPGGIGYNPQYGSYRDRFRKTNYNGAGGHMQNLI